jgi:hypothetical protein
MRARHACGSTQPARRTCRMQAGGARCRSVGAGNSSQGGGLRATMRPHGATAPGMAMACCRPDCDTQHSKEHVRARSGNPACGTAHQETAHKRANAIGATATKGRAWGLATPAVMRTAKNTLFGWLCGTARGGRAGGSLAAQRTTTAACRTQRNNNNRLSALVDQRHSPPRGHGRDATSSMGAWQPLSWPPPPPTNGCADGSVRAAQGRPPAASRRPAHSSCHPRQAMQWQCYAKQRSSTKHGRKTSDNNHHSWTHTPCAAHVMHCTADSSQARDERTSRTCAVAAPARGLC